MTVNQLLSGDGKKSFSYYHVLFDESKSFRSDPVVYFCETNSINMLGITIRKTNDNTMGVFQMCAIARSAGKCPPIHRSRNVSGDGVRESATPIDHTANNHSLRWPYPPSVGVFHSFVCMT